MGCGATGSLRASTQSEVDCVDSSVRESDFEDSDGGGAGGRSTAKAAADAGCGDGCEKNTVEVATQCEDLETVAICAEEDWSWRRTVLGQYEVRGSDVLGVGNFSVVRRGLDQRSGAAVAVKCLKEADHRKFRREVLLFLELFDGGRCLELTPHDRPPALSSEALAEPVAAGDVFVRLLDHSPLDHSALRERYCVLELGLFSLHDLVVHDRDVATGRRGTSSKCIDHLEVFRVLLHVTRGSLYLHDRLFVHGDLKPANVMWFGGADGAWKLIDLDGLLIASQLVDMSDANFFTPIYAAPELARAVAEETAMRVSRKLDVWSAGMMLLEMDLLEPPLQPKFEECCSAGEEDGLDRFLRWLGEDPAPVPLPDTPRVISPEFLQLLRDRILVVDPLQRISMRELADHPLLQQACTRVSGAPQPSLHPLDEAVVTHLAAKETPTAWQLFRKAKAPELEEQGLQGTPLVRELHRRWKMLQAQGGEELLAFQRQEAELRRAAVRS